MNLVEEVVILLQDKYDKDKHTPSLIKKHLTARSFDTKAAANSIIKTDEWRFKVDIDYLVTKFQYKESKQVNELFPRYYHKVDKQGHPLLFVEFDKLDGNKLFKVTNKEDFIKDHIRKQERQVAYYSKKNPTADEKVSAIFNLHNAYLSQFPKFTSVVIDYLKIMLRNYPESLHKIIIINTPMLFSAVWAVIRQFLDQRSLSKVEILGCQYHKYIQEMVGPDNLPKKYGGACECEGGCDNKDLGPWNENGEEIEPRWDFEGRDVNENGSRSEFVLTV